MYQRKLKSTVEEYLSFFPVVAILGPRQCGKTTLAKEIAAQFDDALYLDLERDTDLQKLADPELYLNNHAGRLIVIDEIQIRKDLFPAVRSFVDTTERKSPLLILGSASPELIRQSSETLAGRIAYCELTPFICEEIDEIPISVQWTRGGFPDSITAPKDQLSYVWREFYIRTFIERDLPQLGLRLPAPQLHRLLSLLAHSHGDMLNASKLGEALGVSHTAFRHYVDFLESAYLIRTLKPTITNLKKRLVKSPKVYIRDVGILHSILKIKSFDNLLGHPSVGGSWEGFAIEQILSSIDSDWEPSFYRTQSGAEMDLVLERGVDKIGIEFKVSTAPKVTRGFWSSKDDLHLERCFVVCPIDEIYDLKEDVQVSGIKQCIAGVNQM